ncbi:hypothetical protein CDAR_274451 [Caerostris darwini]|uniref:C2H2-type domain-containing protein n=1 Tax=Caerostris darwini TaxID=1538125 RepID=A0AAV4RHP5_9ARAC|nr:hypothetical protein CDAR_274451 [Caerostris darwini]
MMEGEKKGVSEYGSRDGAEENGLQGRSDSRWQVSVCELCERKIRTSSLCHGQKGFHKKQQLRNAEEAAGVISRNYRVNFSSVVNFRLPTDFVETEFFAPVD